MKMCPSSGQLCNPEPNRAARLAQALKEPIPPAATIAPSGWRARASIRPGVGGSERGEHGSPGSEARIEEAGPLVAPEEEPVGNHARFARFVLSEELRPQARS
jgi:hypothetical protein